jgi:HAD superfamily phosphoserine phosphatase-like hydrolase
MKKAGGRKFKLVVFDLDGTVIDGTASIWKTFHSFLGLLEHPRRLELRRKFFAGKISYRQWAFDDLDLIKEHGADQGKMMKAMEGLRLMKGARETLAALKAKGCVLGIISGSMDIVLERLLPDYKKIFRYVYIPHLAFDAQGRIKGIEVGHDFSDKSKALMEICIREGIDLEQCVFVGDNYNDIQAARIAGLSIAFNSGSEKLNAVADVVIEKKDLREILKHL